MSVTTSTYDIHPVAYYNHLFARLSAVPFKGLIVEGLVSYFVDWKEEQGSLGKF